MASLTVSADLAAEAVALRRDLHAHPELGFAEHRTAGIVAERLKALGLEVHTGIGGTGVVAILAGAQPGPTIMLRADMDALPMPEENDVPYVSQNAGVTHACGHDAHVAMLLGAATILQASAAELRGRIAFVFQPAEEGGGGARAMLDDGLIARIGAINGGTTYNVIPPRVALKGTVRSFSDAVRAEMEAGIRRIAEHTCAAAKATCVLDWHPSYPVTANDPAEAAFVSDTLAAEFGAARVLQIPPVMGSEDFSYFAQVVPACFWFLGAGDATHAFPNHHPAFDIDEKALVAGIAAYVTVALAATSR
jgi:metal-dependent amidase/aminoacylase/carboxypeptidase family protein